MDTCPDHLLDQPLAAPPAPLCVGFSGGLDSTVLLHWLAASPAVRARGLSALHVHHGLQAEADDWARHCRQVAGALGVPLQVVRVQVRDTGRGPEAAARQARRAAFAAHLATGQWLVLGHHRDDQAETFLLRALRGSGVDGLGAIRARDRLGPHTLWRPLLDLPRSTLEAYARRHGLAWIEDPSNASERFDRNFLRHRVLPLLATRWPQAAAALAHSAGRCAADAALLAEATAAWLASARTDRADALDIPALCALAAGPRARVLRAWLRDRGAPPLPGHLHAALDRSVLASPTDRQARLAWAGGWELRRWRDHLHLLPPALRPDPSWAADWDGRAPLPLPDGRHLVLDGAAGFAFPLRVALRRGGERLRLPGRDHHHALKDCLQQAGIPPWERGRLPLLWHGDTLLAAGDVLRAAAFAPPLVPAGAQLRLAAASSGD